MKQIVISIFALLMSASGAFATDISCTNATGNFTYSFYSYAGGPAPAPGMVSSREIWSVQGQPLFRETHYFSCARGSEMELCPPSEENIIDPDLTIRFMAGTEVILWESNPHEPWMNAKKYVVQAEIFRPSGKPIPVFGQARFDDYLICYFENVMRP